jgi:two-component system KDP operon response regulator KdpE
VTTEHRVLIVDDEPAIRRVLEMALQDRGFVTHVAADGESGMTTASATEPDVTILDLGLPDIDGIEVCRHLRRWTANPIIVLTVDDGENRKVDALDAGADDYVTKPFSVPELLARVGVAMRHREALARSLDAAVIVVGDLHIDTATHEAVSNDSTLVLTRKEFAILTVLARNAGRVIPHQTLLSAGWGRGAADRGGRLRVHITHLRTKLRLAESTLRIVSEPGVGYRLVATPRDAEVLGGDERVGRPTEPH